MNRLELADDPIPVIKNKNKFRKGVRALLNFARINYRTSIAPGISLFGLNFFRDSRPGPHKFRSVYALDHALALRPSTVLDVGSGGGYHAKAFARAGSRVLCVDYGTSVYATESSVSGLNVVNVDFMKFETAEKFDLIWASHILEHQRNVGRFIEKLIECCSPQGNICITLPDPHRKLWGGHLTLWTPGLLAYNIVLCGVDISDAFFVRGTDEFSIFFKPRRVALPDLTFDSGDIDLLAKYLPQGLTENADPWKIKFATPAR